MSQEQAAIFRALKPACVALSQITLQHKGNRATGKQLLQTLDSLYMVLKAQPILNVKLADYVFFPLSYMFRESARLPFKATEISLKCLHLLITRGWRNNVEFDLFQQLLILLTSYVAGMVGTEAKRRYDEGIVTASFTCLLELFQNQSHSGLSFTRSPKDMGLPLLGHMVSVTLEVLTVSHSSHVQLAALGALDAFISWRSNVQELRNFLPGIVSGLTRLLQPSTTTRKSFRVLEKGLQALHKILRATIGDDTLIRATTTTASNPLQSTDEPGTKETWFQAASVQIKLALANVIKLRDHEKSEVIQALLQLCLMGLQDCKRLLFGCQTMLMETAVIICSTHPFSDATTDLQKIQYVVGGDGSISDSMRVSIREWLLAFPRVLRCKDPRDHRRYMAQICTAYQILGKLSDGMDALDSALTLSLRESVIIAMNQVPLSYAQFAQAEDTVLPVTINSIDTEQGLELPQTILSCRVDGNKILQEIKRGLRQLGSSHSLNGLKEELVANLENSAATDKQAILWLISTLLQVKLESAIPLGHFVDIPRCAEDMDNSIDETVYRHCIEILSAPIDEDANDWRQQAIALDLIAIRAGKEKVAFRPELVDALYPVVERMTSSNPVLREHAMTCLNIIARSCGYLTQGSLILHNVDYLVNAISLNFNTFEISPAAAHVLLIMLHLCGPSLVPYLDDLVESIFLALACFHGYSRLVESLFAVLASIVEKGSLHSLSLNTQALSRVCLKSHLVPITVANVVTLLGQKSRYTGYQAELPMRPQRQGEGKLIASEAQGHVVASLNHDKTPQKQTKTHELVESIMRLGQHYLTHKSSKLRQKLLQLLAVGCLALSNDEDIFLPLINEIWPMVVKRMYDPEVFVQIAAMDTILQICQLSGDFVTSRIEDEWNGICKLYRCASVRLTAEDEGRGGRGQFTSAHQLRDALTRILIGLVGCVRITADMEDDIMDLLGPHAHEQSDIRVALSHLNADAAWLIDHQRQQQMANSGDHVRVPVPIFEGFTFLDLETVI